jgi:tetratricopeptide (TPR) repeat protein
MRASGGSFLVAILVFGSAAHADREKARATYRLGIQHYNLAEYGAALESFKQAYREYEEPTLLFNIAQCHRQLGQKQEAVTFYKTYLREVPSAENREEVKRLIGVLEQDLSAEQVAHPKSTEPVSHAAAQPSPAPILLAAPSQAPAAVPKKRPLWIIGVAIGAAAAVALGVGLGVGLSSKELDPTPSLGSVTKN